MKNLFPVFFIVFLISCSTIKKDDYVKEIEEYQFEENLKFHDASKSPLTKEDLKTFKKLEFYPIDKKYRVLAQIEKTVNAPIFEMTTTTSRKPLYIKYGTLTFTLDGIEQNIPVYQNKDIDRDPQYIDNLFIPFTDKTSGEGSYGGGRYIDVLTTDEKPDGTIIVDFNKAYNPYCAYSDRYSCPLTPKENTLSVAIPAGVKAYKKH